MSAFFFKFTGLPLLLSTQVSFALLSLCSFVLSTGSCDQFIGISSLCSSFRDFKARVVYIPVFLNFLVDLICSVFLPRLLFPSSCPFLVLPGLGFIISIAPLCLLTSPSEEEKRRLKARKVAGIILTSREWVMTLGGPDIAGQFKNPANLF